MDAALPNGTYTFTIGGHAANLSLTGDLYPVMPQVIGVTNGAWNGGRLIVSDPTKDCVLTFNTFTNYANGSGGVASGMGFGIVDSKIDIWQYVSNSHAFVSATSDSLYSATPFTTYTIPANTLTLGDTYDASLFFATFVSVNTTSISGGTGGDLYGVETDFTIQAGSGDGLLSRNDAVEKGRRLGSDCC